MNTPIKVLPTKVLSARVSPDVYSAWQNMAKSKGISVSECLRDAVTMVDTKAIIKAQDGIVVPDDVRNILGAIGGGSVCGILVYKGIKATLEANYGDNMSKGEIDTISTLLALSGALLVGTGIYKSLK